VFFGLSETVLSEIALSEIALSEIALSEIVLSEIALSEIALSEIALSEIVLSEMMIEMSFVWTFCFSSWTPWPIFLRPLFMVKERPNLPKALASRESHTLSKKFSPRFFNTNIEGFLNKIEGRGISIANYVWAHNQSFDASVTLKVVKSLRPEDPQNSEQWEAHVVPRDSNNFPILIRACLNAHS